VLLSFAASAAFAQSFEVASIKPSRVTTGNSGWHSDPGEMVISNMSLQELMEESFEVRDFSLSGPAWLDNARFDINARMQPGTAAHDRNLMIQALLKERFGLTIHHETRTLQGFALVPAKNGFKLQPVAEDPRGSSWSTGKGKITAKQTPVSRLADLLSNEIGRPVNDATGIKGIFDFTLTYSPDSGGDDSRASIYTALEEQLGLRLEARKVPVDVIVVDHVERMPSEN
jgi:uncharacterized protein (TIGR03435 family)